MHWLLLNGQRQTTNALKMRAPENHGGFKMHQTQAMARFCDSCSKDVVDGQKNGLALTFSKQ